MFLFIGGSDSRSRIISLSNTYTNLGNVEDTNNFPEISPIDVVKRYEFGFEFDSVRRDRSVTAFSNFTY